MHTIRNKLFSLNLITLIETMTQKELEEYFMWLKDLGREHEITWQTITAFLMDTRPEFICGAYNFNTPNFKIGFYIKYGDNKFDIFFLDRQIASELLFKDIYGMWRNQVSLKKYTKSWEQEVKKLMEIV